MAELSELVGDANASAVYNALADSLVDKFNAVYLSQNHSSPPSGNGGTMCGESQEVRKGGHVINLDCGAGRTIEAIEAFFGTPHGNCSTGFSRDPVCDDAVWYARMNPSSPLFLVSLCAFS